VYNKHAKNMVSTSLPVDSESTAVDPHPPHSVSLSTAPHFLQFRWILLLL